MLKHFFQKKSRLSNSNHFQYVFNKPIRKNTLAVSILGRCNIIGYPRLGISISRKNIKFAHNRNLIKRLIRETFRLLQHNLKSMDFIVIAKKHIFYLNNKNIIDTLNNVWTNYYR